jgi:hypothetical protein
MIVKDGGSGLERCLRSVVPFVDRVIIGDTGSSDGSREVARRAGAEVIDIPWEQDFASARNRVLAERKCDWILIVDADEMLDPLSGANLRNFIKNSSAFACRNEVWHYVDPSTARIGPESARKNPVRLENSRPYASYVPLNSVRLFRNHPEIFYENCVHETVEKRLATLHLPPVWGDIIVHHFGFVENQGERDRKNDIYHDLCEAKLKASPDDSQVLIELGISELEHHKDPKAALTYFTRARDIDRQNAFAWLYCGVCLSRVGKQDEALANLAWAKKLGLSTGVLIQATADANFQKGFYAEADLTYKELELRGEASPTSEAKRGACEVHLGQNEVGLGRIQRAISSAPHSAELYDILAPAAMLSGQLALAVEAMQYRISLGNLTGFHSQMVELLAKACEQRPHPAISSSGAS